MILIIGIGGLNYVEVDIHFGKGGRRDDWEMLWKRL